MKFHFKHVATAALAVAMSLSLAVPAFAEGPAAPTPVTKGNLTVTGHELTGKNVFAVRMFKATATKNSGDSGYDYASYELEDNWLPFFKAEKEPGVTGSEYSEAEITLPQSPTKEDYKKAALKYLEWLATNKNNNEKNWADFAEEAQDWLYAQESPVFTVKDTEGVKTVTIADAWDDNKLASYVTATEVDKPADNLPTGTATFTDLPTGYYVVYPEGGSTGNNIGSVAEQPARGTDAMLINIPTGNKKETWNIKSTFPTVDKTVKDENGNTPDKDGAGAGNADNGSAQVGEEVTFTLTSKVPDMSDYQDDGDKFYFAFHDTLSKGLEFVEDSVSVTIGKVSNDALTTSYDVTEPAPANGNKLDIVFEKLNEVPGISVGDTITVTYRAKITKDAVSEPDHIFGAAENDVYLEYSNNPSTEDHGTSTPDKSKVYTYDIKIEKYWVDAASVDVDIDGSWDGNHDMELESLSLDSGAGEKLLAGATFVLSNSDKTPSEPYGSNGEVKLVLMEDGNYRVATDKDITGTTYEFTTTNTAPIIIKGLEAGTYYLHEIDAPDGFNKLKEPVEIQIVVEPILGNDATNNATLDNPVYIIDDTANGQVDNAVKVLNKKGIELPETGSIGTIGLTVAGVAIVLLGVFAPRKKKKSNQE